MDEDGRRYAYDEAHRLIEVKSPAPDADEDEHETVLAGYGYDAFGRRITSNIGGVVTRYYYDGPNVIEERSAAGALLRSHVNGAQYIDERIATVSGGLTTYYLLKENYSVAATGNADGSQIIRWDYSSGGALDGASRSRDLDADNDVDQSDFGLFQVCLNGSGVPVGPECADQDLDGDTDVDQTDLGLWSECASGPAIPLPRWCAGTVPSTFALHGRPVDVLPDGHVLQDHRARHYDPRHGRWLQRDPLGYVDGANLYESFKGNAARFVDPLGREGEEGTMFESFARALYRLRAGEHPLTGESLEDRALRRAGVFTEPNAQRRALLEHLDRAEHNVRQAIEKAEPVVARVAGGVQAVGGAAESTTGVIVVVGSEGIGAVPGVVYVLHGLDVMGAGVAQVITGEFTPTLTYSAIAEAGYPRAAMAVDVGTSLGSGVSALRLSVEGPTIALAPVRSTGHLWSSAENVRAKFVVFLYDAKLGDYVLGSGFSPGQIFGEAPRGFVPGAYLPGMGAYKAVGGHHPLSGRAFGYSFYDEAMAIGQEMMGLTHPQPLTSLQQQGYMAFGRTGEPLTITRMTQIEVDAMVKAGMPRAYAEQAVSRAVWERFANRQFTPTHIPWVGANPGVGP